MRVSRFLSPPLTMVLVFGVSSCDRGRSDADAAAVSSAREAQIRAEAELKAIKELAAKAPQPAPQPAEAVTPAAAEQAPTAPKAAPPATHAAPPAATVDPTAAACGCKTPACACVTVTVSLAPSARKPDGQDWDPMGGAPDPQVTLRTPLVSRKSGVFKDQLAVTTSFAGVPLSPGDSIAVDAFDADTAVADPMGSFATTFTGIGSTKSGSVAAASVTVSFSR